ncbi:hypothetical protein HanPSC8_Chr07g0277111 [Helianthus annuus]|nr:hypothetical protein HanPSC8_Chr07g0277111 [Helianthus annuus]
MNSLKCVSCIEFLKKVFGLAYGVGKTNKSISYFLKSVWLSLYDIRG